MTRYIIRRLLQAIPTLLGISIISFLLVNCGPRRSHSDPHL